MTRASFERALTRIGLRPLGPEELAIARIGFFGWLFIRNLPLHSEAWLPFAKLAFRQQGILAVLGIRFLDPPWVDVVDRLFQLSLLLGTLGLFTPVATLASFGLGLYTMGLPQGIGKIHHAEGILMFALVGFILSKPSDAWSLDAWIRKRRAPEAPSPVASIEYAWPLALATLLLVGVYFSAGVSKLRASGLEWAWNEAGRVRFLAHYYTRDVPTNLGLWLGQPGIFHKIGGTLALSLEVLAPLAFVHRWPRAIIVLGLFGLQVGIWLTMGVFFSNGFALFLMCLAPLGLRLFRTVRRTLARPLAEQPI